MISSGPALAALLLIIVATARGEAASGDAGRGKEVFARNCAVCHTVVPEYHKEGPSLAGIFGRRAGSVPFFAHYRGLRGSEVIWNEQTLDAWLADPKGFLGGRDTNMTFKLTDEQERADVIAYLKTLK